MLMIWYLLFFQLLSWILHGIAYVSRKIPVIGWIFTQFDHIGMYFHELLHYLVSKLLWVKALKSQVQIRGNNHGEFILNFEENPGFFKMMAIATAPITLGTILIIQILHWWHSIPLSLEMEIIVYPSLFLLIFIISPSWADYRCIFSSISAKPGVFFKQVGFIGITLYLIYYFQSWFTTWLPLFDVWYEIGVFVITFGVIELGWWIIGTIFDYILFPHYRTRPLKLKVFKNDPNRLRNQAHIKSNVRNAEEHDQLTGNPMHKDAEGPDLEKVITEKYSESII
jgi:hypothetical protein